MTKTKKIWLGILSFLPLISSFILIIASFNAIFSNRVWDQHYEAGEVSPFWIIGNLAYVIIWAVIVGIIQLVLIVYFIILAVQNHQIESTERIIWILVFIIASTLSLPIYWGIRIWPKEKPVSNFIKEE